MKYSCCHFRVDVRRRVMPAVFMKLAGGHSSYSININLCIAFTSRPNAEAGTEANVNARLK